MRRKKIVLGGLLLISSLIFSILFFGWGAQPAECKTKVRVAQGAGWETGLRLRPLPCLAALDQRGALNVD